MGVRRTKSGEREIDMRPLALSLEAREGSLYARLMLTERDTLKPDVLLGGLASLAGVEAPRACIASACWGKTRREMVPLMEWKRMSKTILIDRLCGETGLALIGDGALAELYFESKGHEKLTGNIYAGGRVENVLPGMNAAFVNIGLDKNAFLYAGDIRVGDAQLAEQLRGARIEQLVRRGRRSWCRWPRNRAATRGRVFPATSRWPAA